MVSGWRTRGVVAVLLSVGLFQAVSLAQQPARVRSDSKANKILAELEQEYATRNFSDAWAWQLKALCELPPDSLPDLIAELDATDSDNMLRCLGFALRSIGDKRAVPALIRALPKTLRKPGSDMGLASKERELLEFMQKHDLDEKGREERYSFGRPVREIAGALQKLTGTKLGEEEIFGVFLRDGPHQQRMQKQLYRRYAERWAAWWADHWREHVTDKKFAAVGLPNDDLPAGQLFPQGPSVNFGGRSSGHTAESDTDASAGPQRDVFYDLDTGRRSGFPTALAGLKNDPHRLDKIHAWAAREGFDLMGTMYQPPGEQQPRYAIRSLGLTAWEIDVKAWETLDADIHSEKPLTIGQPAGGLLLHFDEQQSQYDPLANAAFLFVTREGTYGALFIGVEVLDTNVKLDVPVRGDQALNPVGFRKGRRFSIKIVEPAEADAK